MAEVESKHADELRKRGFEKLPDLTVPRAEKAKWPPSFTISSRGPVTLTFATDETGQSWGTQGVADLTDLGFNNTTKTAREHAEKVGMIPKSH